MNDTKIPTSELLARAMEQAKCPQHMIDKARAFYYDDYKSQLAAPCIQLVDDLISYPELRKRAINGEFDAQAWESDEWASDPKTVEEFKSSGMSEELLLNVFGIGVKH